MNGLVGSRLGRQVDRINKPVDRLGRHLPDWKQPPASVREGAALVGLRNGALESRGISESFASTNALPSCLLGQRRLIFCFLKMYHC